MFADFLRFVRLLFWLFITSESQKNQITLPAEDADYPEPSCFPGSSGRREVSERTSKTCSLARSFSHSCLESLQQLAAQSQERTAQGPVCGLATIRDLFELVFVFLLLLFIVFVTTTHTVCITHEQTSICPACSDLNWRETRPLKRPAF